ncbi:MAG: dihydropteroate synthase [Acidobacteria bacterium]|nr:dihydropteroate synthase [Acidobacteriota bacterium]
METIAARGTFTIPLADGRSLALGARTLVMGIVNATPDSFAGSVADPDEAAALALRMEEAGADIIDIGGESTRPGAEPVSEANELARVIPVIERLVGRLHIPISVDTYKAGVAAAALSAGACIVNDISGLGYDHELADVVARSQAAVVLMHTRGRSRQMYRDAVYSDVVVEVAAELRQAMDRATAAGISADRIILDPGLGFAKRADDSFMLLAALPRLHALGRPLLIGPSRKSFLTAAMGPAMPAERDWGTAAAVTAAILSGAHIVRVHDVGPMVQVARVADAIRQRART